MTIHRVPVPQNQSGVHRILRGLFLAWDEGDWTNWDWGTTFGHLNGSRDFWYPNRSCSVPNGFAFGAS